MSTFLITLQNDTLYIGPNPEQPATTDRLVQDAIAKVDHMLAQGNLPGGPLLKVNGPAPLPVCFALAHKLAPIYRAIAAFDPKVNSYIVVITQDAAYTCGELIQQTAIAEGTANSYSPVKVVLCGPPRSGKSCLRQGLKQAISQLPNAPYPYVITACPDGEGAWFSEAAQRDPQIARQLKDAYKTNFTPAFATLAAGWVSNTQNPLTLIDVGGKRTDENKRIMAPASHAIILSGDPSQIPEWEDFCQSLSLTIIAKVHSDYNQTQDNVVTSPSGPITGHVHHLERGEDISTRPMVQALAHQIVQLTSA